MRICSIVASAASRRALHAFLYAYIGRLIDDVTVVEHGLAAMAEAAPNDPLVPALQTIWLAAPEPPDAPPPPSGRPDESSGSAAEDTDTP